ncbi:MAG: sugar transferase [Halobacteriovoraceae bacterium]|nr:sugar transferase [Halobacteriovoraceae bacterium]
MFDRLFSIFLIIILSPILLLITAILKLVDSGPVFFWSKRVGKNNVLFNMPKFRTMKLGTPAVATHLLKDSDSHVFPFGSFLRKTSLDELPQLWSILIGDMVFVGPRPALFNQEDLIKQRTSLNVHKVKPGVTGWAQINGRDELSIEEKVKFDYDYTLRKSFLFDLEILLKTFFSVLRKEGIKH